MSERMKKKIIVSVIIFAICVVAVFALLIYKGTMLLNNPSRNDYPVRGIDVSSYQGEIDWRVIAAQGIDFAFIKATEGSSYVDPNFAANLSGAEKTDLRVGAYHFFSYDSGGETQADNFISVVPKTDGMLPPVVDFEFYGDKESNLPEKTSVQKELQILLDRLEEQYGLKPIIYATEKSYELYISGAFDNYGIWIRNVVFKPKLDDGRDWTFWQYTNRETLKGYEGEEKYIDMNVFSGTAEEFESYPMN